MKEPFWTHHNAEDGYWNSGSQCATKEEAIADAKAYGYEAGDTLYVGRAVPVNMHDLLRVIDTDVFEKALDRLSDLMGEDACDDFPPQIIMTDLQPHLDKAIATWLDENPKMRDLLRFQVEDVEEVGIATEETT